MKITNRDWSSNQWHISRAEPWLVCSDVIWRKEMCYLMTHSTHFIYRLYVVRHMVKEQSDCDSGNPLPPHGILFLISSKGFLYAPSHRQDSTYHSFCYTSHGALAGTRRCNLSKSIKKTCQSTFMNCHLLNAVLYYLGCLIQSVQNGNPLIFLVIAFLVTGTV